MTLWSRQSWTWTEFEMTHQKINKYILPKKLPPWCDSGGVDIPLRQRSEENAEAVETAEAEA